MEMVVYSTDNQVEAHGSYTARRTIQSGRLDFKMIINWWQDRQTKMGFYYCVCFQGVFSGRFWLFDGYSWWHLAYSFIYNANCNVCKTVQKVLKLTKSTVSNSLYSSPWRPVVTGRHSKCNYFCFFSFSSMGVHSQKSSKLWKKQNKRRQKKIHIQLACSLLEWSYKGGRGRQHRRVSCDVPTGWMRRAC